MPKENLTILEEIFITPSNTIKTNRFDEVEAAFCNSGGCSGQCGRAIDESRD